MATPAATGRPAQIKALTMKVAKTAGNDCAFTNLVYVHPEDAELLTLRPPSTLLPLSTYVMLRDFVFVFSPDSTVPKGCIGLANHLRTKFQLALGDSISVVVFAPTTDCLYLSSVTLEVDVRGKQTPGAPAPSLSSDELAKIVLQRFDKHVFSAGQQLLVPMDAMVVTLNVKEIMCTSAKSMYDATSTGADSKGSTCGRGVLVANTDVRLERAPGTVVKLTGGKVEGGGSSGSGVGLFRTKNLNPELLGVGGLDAQFMDLVRRTLTGRIFPPSVMQKLGVSHVKGILLYGPPGTGKTLMARTISKMLNGKEPKVVAGPELFNKYVGETEKGIRDLFKEAQEEYKARGDDSDLHVIVLDEIDALCKTRGSRGDSTGVGDSAVNQLLAMIDGVNALNNILVIGMTNRIDMIDEALLRPGRLEVHIEVGLPDERGRLQIFRIHTASMLQNKFLSPDVDLAELAHLTKNYTGAEIAGVVKNAVTYALSAKVDYENLKEIANPEDIVITKEHFSMAVANSEKPAFGVDEADLSRNYANGIVEHGASFTHLVSMAKTLFKQARESARTPLVSFLLSGKPGSGKTALATWLAHGSGFPFVKLITPDDLIRFGSEQARCSRIVQAFDDAYKSSNSVVVIDDIERLLDYVPIGNRFSNTVLQTLLVLIKRPPPTDGRKLLIIGTTSEPNVLRAMGMYNVFNAVLDVPLVRGPRGIKSVLSCLAGGPITPAVIETACSSFPEDAELPMKRLIMATEMARQHADPIKEGGFVSSLLSEAALSSTFLPTSVDVSSLSSSVDPVATKPSIPPY